MLKYFALFSISIVSTLEINMHRTEKIKIREIDEVEVHYQTKLQDISDLRQSLLQKAFAGELTWDTQSLHTA